MGFYTLTGNETEQWKKQNCVWHWLRLADRNFNLLVRHNLIEPDFVCDEIVSYEPFIFPDGKYYTLTTISNPPPNTTITHQLMYDAPKCGCCSFLYETKPQMGPGMTCTTRQPDGTLVSVYTHAELGPLNYFSR